MSLACAANGIRRQAPTVSSCVVFIRSNSQTGWRSNAVYRVEQQRTQSGDRWRWFRWLHRNAWFLPAVLVAKFVVRLRPLRADILVTNRISMAATDEFLPTRKSLLTRLKNWEDQEGWREFFEMYWRLIYRVATKAGFNDSEAQDVVQDTVLAVAKKMRGFKYD